MARRSWRSSLRNGRPLFFSPSPSRPRSEPSRARMGTISRKPLSTSQWRSVSGSCASGERGVLQVDRQRVAGVGDQVASAEEASSRRLAVPRVGEQARAGVEGQERDALGVERQVDLAGDRRREVRDPLVARMRSTSRVRIWRASYCSRKKCRSIESSRVLR